jgi:hypothetical protein
MARRAGVCRGQSAASNASRQDSSGEEVRALMLDSLNGAEKGRCGCPQGPVMHAVGLMHFQVVTELDVVRTAHQACSVWRRC